jgi:hypothetical protein
MTTPINFFRSDRHQRSIFREGRYLLNTEGMELQLEIIQAIRKQVKAVFGDYSAIDQAVKVEIDPNNNQRIIVRPGEFFLDGYSLSIQAGTDHRVELGVSPAAVTSSDFVRVQNNGSDVGGIAINLGGATPLAAGSYALVLSIEEELITAGTDPFLRSANLNEDTAEKHRIILNVNIVEVADLDESPVPYRGTADGNLVNGITITRNGGQYAVVNTQQITGSETIDGRNLEITFNNGNGTSSAAFPVSNDNISEFIHGKLIDSNGVEYHITNMFVTPGNSSQVTMFLDLEKNRPVLLNTYQPEPQILDGIPYKLVKRDLYVTTPANLPSGKRFWEVAYIYWDGTSLTDPDEIDDLRQEVLAYNGVLGLIRDKGLDLYSEAQVTWDTTQAGGLLEWSEDLKIYSVFDPFEWTIPASDTFTLFAEPLALGEVLYVRLEDAPTGGIIPLRKGVRGLGDLSLEGIKAHKVYWIAKRHSDNRVYFANGFIINDQTTDSFFKIPPARLLPQDILSLGFKAMYDEDFVLPSVYNPVNSTGLYFAESYTMSYSNRSITVVGNDVTLDSAPSFDMEAGDVVIQGGNYTVVTAVISDTEIQVANGALLSDGDATVSQTLETFNLRDLGDSAKERISSHFSDSVNELLLTYDDLVIPVAGNEVRVGFSLTANGTTYTGVLQRQESIEDLELKVTGLTSGLDVRVRFFAIPDSGDGTATLESFRAFFHRRNFVGTLLTAVAQGSVSTGSSGSVIFGPEDLTNGTGSAIAAGRAVRITSSGIELADASSVSSAKSLVGVTAEIIPDGSQTEQKVISRGRVNGVLLGLGFTAGEEVYLGLNGELIKASDVNLFPSGYAQKEVGFAINTTDLWVQIGTLEIL